MESSGQDWAGRRWKVHTDGVPTAIKAAAAANEGVER
jgi:hypothetical protein